MTVHTIYDELKRKLHDVVPDAELRIKAEVAEEILRVKQERNAVILGHNYMEPALFHSVPDFTGDSLALCHAAANTDAETIVFCGVRFMAETAKILNPGKNVLLPSAVGGCSLAASITAEDVRELKAKHPGAPVVVYINTYADVKAEADYCCTSGNAADIGVAVLAHPECSPEVTHAADFAGSTAAMIKEVRESEAPNYLLLTECSMGDNIMAENPDKEMIGICSVRCPHMNEITLEQTLASLRENRYVIDVPEPVRSQAARSIERMMAL